VIASHATNDGATMTKPQHASMLTGYNTETHGITENVTKGHPPEGTTIYERLMDAFDPALPELGRNGLIFRTHHSGDRKYVGKAIYYWAKRSRALQVTSGTGNETGDLPGPLRYAERSFERWRLEADALGQGDPGFFMFLHFKATDWAGHRNGEGSRQYRRVIMETDRKLYALLELLRRYGWDDAAVLVTTDHGFHRDQHVRNGGRTVFNTWLAAHDVHLVTDHIPLRTPEDYCASHGDPEACLAEGPPEPMPAADVVPNVYVTSITPTLLDMFGVEWRTTTSIEGVSLYVP
jgi:predicted AlkP superfamily pyrophosphatase or phosphodiesterase